MSKPTHLEPSELGTKEYWDNLYATELSNHADNPADTGTVWFDDSDAEAKLIEFLTKAAAASMLHSYMRLTLDYTSFLDLGTGNGSLLFGLRDAGWRGRMLGVDYSRQSVELARRIAEARSRSKSHDSADSPATETPDQDQDKDSDSKLDSSAAATSSEKPVEFLEHDILRSPASALLADAQQPKGWGVVLDKGTFDAISLSSEVDPATGRRVSESYGERVAELMRDGGLFLVTSCNWTEDELRGWFESSREDGKAKGWRFKLVGKVDYPSFSFGGVTGQTITSLCFKKMSPILEESLLALRDWDCYPTGEDDL